MTERTKIWIADKMKELMLKKPIEKIRVTEICSAAEIERSTFYYHFQDKYDLVAWIFYHSAYKTDVISVKEATESMKQVKRDLIFYKRVYEDSSPNPLWYYMLEYFVKQYTKRAQEILQTDILDKQLQFSIRLYCYGAISMTREWVLYDNKTPAETSVKMMFESMPESLKEIYFGPRGSYNG